VRGGPLYVCCTPGHCAVVMACRAFVWDGRDLSRRRYGVRLRLLSGTWRGHVIGPPVYLALAGDLLTAGLAPAPPRFESFRVNREPQARGLEGLKWSGRRWRAGANQARPFIGRKRFR
jgi:hypothetical protein